jgi:hypothetical protein
MIRRGFKPPIAEAFHAFCCDCTANYGDGRIDCQHTGCPSYSRHKFRMLKPTFEWFFGPWSNNEQEYRALGMTKEAFLDMKLGNPRKPNYRDIFRAQCFRCNGDFKGGSIRQDCEIPTCSIYYWMPYRHDLPVLDWMFDLDYTDRHRVAAITEGYVIKGSTLTIIDRHRYYADKLLWTGEQIIQTKPRRVRKIA